MNFFYVTFSTGLMSRILYFTIFQILCFLQPYILMKWYTSVVPRQKWVNALNINLHVIAVHSFTTNGCFQVLHKLLIWSMIWKPEFYLVPKCWTTITIQYNARQCTANLYKNPLLLLLINVQHLTYSGIGNIGLLISCLQVYLNSSVLFWLHSIEDMAGSPLDIAIHISTGVGRINLLGSEEGAKFWNIPWSLPIELERYLLYQASRLNEADMGAAM